ncbi:MAG: hypothetical protein ACTHLN_05395, partial [Tepidisphaeraceae bacterium]
WNGMTAESPEFRRMFTREHLLASDWYQERLARQQRIDLKLLDRHEHYLTKRMRQLDVDPASRAACEAKLVWLKRERERVGSASYRASLVGTIGVDAIAE